VTTWLSVASKAAGLILLTRLVVVFCSALPEGAYTTIQAFEPLAWAIGIVATVTCTVGNFAAYKQQSVKRLLAYSSIAHAGYMMMAAAVFVYPHAEGYKAAGLTALLAYIIIYLFMNLGAFGVTALIVWDTGSDKIESFTGLARRAPWLAVPMVICLVSLVGIPPLAGFIGKWWILVALGTMDISGGHYHYLSWALIIVMSVNTLISLFYYMRVVVQMTLRDDRQGPVRSPLGGIALVNLCAVALLLLFVLSHPLKAMTDRFSRGVFQPTVTAGQAAGVAARPPAAGVEDHVAHRGATLQPTQTVRVGTAFNESD
jgi:NADH-quinone oxidoreductase subunit N